MKKVRLIFIYILSLFYRKRYDKKYFGKKYFSGRMSGMLNIGWRWVVQDARGCAKLMVNRNVLWPVSPLIRIEHPENIEFHPDDLNNFQSYGIYYQAQERIVIGKGTYIGPNVGLITANHNFTDLSKHGKCLPITLGEKCWIGMNSVILPGVVLGNQTIVGAGSIVTKSFLSGKCVIAGNPAKLIRNIEETEEETER